MLHSVIKVFFFKFDLQHVVFSSPRCLKSSAFYQAICEQASWGNIQSKLACECMKCLSNGFWLFQVKPFSVPAKECHDTQVLTNTFHPRSFIMTQIWSIPHKRTLFFLTYSETIHGKRIYLLTGKSSHFKVIYAILASNQSAFCFQSLQTSLLNWTTKSRPYKETAALSGPPDSGKIGGLALNSNPYFVSRSHQVKLDSWIKPKHLWL